MIVPVPYADPRVQQLLCDLSAHYEATFGASDVFDDPASAFTPPAGGVLLALDHHGQPCGVMAYRPGDGDRAEIVRGYVRPSSRGTGVARALFDGILDAAAAAGYRRATGYTTESAVDAIVRNLGGCPLFSPHPSSAGRRYEISLLTDRPAGSPWLLEDTHESKSDPEQPQARRPE